MLLGSSKRQNPEHCSHGRCLTPRSSRPATAGSVSLVRGTWCIIAYQAYAACLRGRLNSNVRRRLSGHPSVELGFGHNTGSRSSASAPRLPAGRSCDARCGPPDRGHRKLFPTVATAALHRLAAAFSVLAAGSRSIRAAVPERGANLRATPNPLLKLTRYGTQRKPGPRPLRHHRVPGLRCVPPRAA